MKKVYIINEEVLNNNSYYDDKMLVIIDDNNNTRTRFCTNHDINLNVYHLSEDTDEIFDTIVDEYQTNRNKQLDDDRLYNDIDDMFDFTERYIAFKNLKNYEVA